MRPKERRNSGQNDLFRARLDQIVDMDHPLAKLGQVIDWRFLEERFGAVYTDKAGHPPLATLRTRNSPRAGSRTPITSCSVARSSSSTSRCSTALR